ncbi:MAG: glycosyltransferase [Candidatus Paceibacterota bacterium]
MNRGIVRPLWLEEIYGGREKEIANTDGFVMPGCVKKINKCGMDPTDCKIKVAFFRDGPFLPVMTGVAASILGMMEALCSCGVKVVLIKAVREFDDTDLYERMPFDTYFLNEADFYGDDNLLIRKILKEEKINIAQFDSAEAINIQSHLIPKEIKKIFEVMDVESDLMIQLGANSEKVEYIRSEEVKTSDNADLFLFRSKENVVKFQENTLLDISHKTHLYRGGIDVKKCPYRNDRFLCGENVLFLGHLNYEPNILALDDISKYIAPYIRKNILVVGDIQENLICKYGHNKNIIFKGRVDNLASVFANAFVGIAPLTVGSGTRLKILDYMAAGLPVICSNLAIEGLEEEIKDFVLTEDDFSRYPELIENIKDHFNVEDIDSALEYILHNRSWDAVIGDVISAYSNILQL